MPQDQDAPYFERKPRQCFATMTHDALISGHPQGGLDGVD